MKRKSTFLRVFALLALLLPWTLQAQNAKVSEYDGVATTATYSSIVGTSGATAWTQGDYVDVSMPFAMNFGENQIASGSTLRVYPNGSVTFTSLAGSQIAPLYLAAGYTTTATSIYTKSTAQMLTVEWRKVVSGTSSYSFQLKLYPGGDIEFCYGPMTINSSISVLVGMMSSTEDIYRVGGANGGSDWSDITRYTSGTTTRTLSSTYAPAYDVATGQGMVYTFTQPACVKPSALTATALAWNSIKVDWTVSSPGNSFEIKYSTDPAFDPSTEGTSVTVSNGTATTYTITGNGLQGSTQYYFYVRKNCSGTPSGWSPMATATTLPGCFNANMPSVTLEGVITWTSPDEMVTSYDVKYGPSGFNPATEGTAVNNLTALTYTIPNLGSNQAYDVYLRTHCSASGLTTDWVGPVNFVSPCVGGCTYMLVLTDTYGDGWNGNHLDYYANGSLMASYANNDETANSEGRNPDNDTIMLSVCAGDQISFVYVADGSYADENVITIFNHENDAIVDGYSGSNGTATIYTGVSCQGITCRKPTNLAITNVDGNNVTLSWTENGTATAWQIAYGLFTNDNDYTVVDATTNPFTVTNLGLGEWHFFVRSNCAANDQSDWLGSVSQTFGYCTPAPVSCDNNGIIGVTFGNDITVNDNNYTTSTTRYQNHSDMIGDLFAGAVSEVSITYDAGYTYGTKVWIDFNNDFDFDDDGELVYTGLSTNSRPTTLVATFTIPVNTPLGDYRMRIGGTDNDSGPDPCYTGSYGCLRDYTVRVVAAPSCFKPNSLTASGITATTANLTWVEAGLSTQWEVKYGPTGFNIAEGEGVSMIVNTTPTLNLEYLDMGVAYDVYVRAICDPEGPTEWHGPVSFTTQYISCLAYGAPGTEENHVIGTGTSTNNYLPCYNYYNYSFTEQIYTAAEVGGSGIINSIAFYNNGSEKTRNIDVYLLETDKNSFSGGTDWVPVTPQQKVYSGSTTFSVGQWTVLTFSTPFTYSGNGNLLVVVDDNTGSYASSPHAAYQVSNATAQALRIYSDGTNYDPVNNPSYSGTVMNVKNNIQLGIQYAQCVSYPVYAPQVDITLSDVEYAATLAFTNTNINETNPTYGMIWGSQGFNPATSGTTVSPITTNTYTISNLAATTTYDVYVYAITSNGNSDTVRYAFTTPFIPNCKTPNTIAASNITYNTAELTWNQPGDVPQTWTVRYAATDFNPATAAATEYTELIVAGNVNPAAQLTGLVAGTTYYVYIKSVCSTSPVDESPWSQVTMASPAFTFTTPTCVVPPAVTASDVTNSTAQISWTEAGTATAWTMRYGVHGFDPDNEGTEIACTTASIELTGLNAYTYYDVYVKSNCTATDESDWSNACTFRTACPDGGDVVMGTGTTATSGVIVNSSWGNTYCQQIFTAEELAAAGMTAGNIQGMTITWNGNGSYQKELSIYMANTNQTDFATTTSWVPIASQTLVYGPTVRPTTGTSGKLDYIFTTPFYWDGSSNIVITTFVNQYGGNQSSSGFNSYSTNSGMTNMAMYKYRDSQAFTESEVDGLTASSRTGYRISTTFLSPCNTDVTCFAPATVGTTVATNNNVAVTWAARTDLRPVVNNFEMKYGLAGFNPDNQGTLVPNLNNVFNYNITAELNYDADYDVYVRTVCGENDHSNWTKATFHTYPSCWAPTALTVTGTTSNSATLSWEENTPTPATRWEVTYGLEGFDPDRVTPIETTNNTAFEVTGLRHTSRYEFYVRAKCSNTDHSPWSAVATGTTQCGTWQYEDMPLVENFDGVTGTTTSTRNAHVLPNCWDYINTSTTTSGTSTTGYPGYPIAYNSASYSHSGNNHMRFYTYTTAAYGDQYAILPQFGFDLDTVVVGFYARESSTTTTYVGTIQVGVMTDPEDASTFEVVGTVLPTTTSYEYFEVNFSEYAGTGRYIALKAPKPTSGYNVAYVDDLTVKLREKVNMLADNGETKAICNEFVMPDTTNGGYHGGLNTTYVIRPAEAGKVVHLTGSYDLENGYDFLNVYRGAANANNLVGRYTGNGTIDFMTGSNLWADSGYVTIVLTTDADNAFNYSGFKLLAQCECPNPDPEVHPETIVANGTYTWRNGTTYTNNVTHTYSDYNPADMGIVEPDLLETTNYTYVNVAGCDSIEYSLDLTVHPTYTLTYNKTICERDEVNFYGETKTATNTYTVPLTSQFGADSTGILVLQVNPAPSAAIYKGGDEVTAITGHCDNTDLTLLARSNVTNATFVWEDNSTAATRVVNPHESNTYTVVATNPTTGCTSLPASVTVTTTPVPALAINGDAVICAGQSATLTVTDANNVDANYRWNTGATGTTITVSPTATTIYTVTATTNNTSACTATAEFTVTVNPLPVVTATASVSEICRDSVVTLNATAVDGYSYSWNTGATTAVATTAATSTAAYTVTVTDQNGCVNEFTTASVTVYPSYELNDELSVCYTNNPYTWGAQTITANGNYDQNFTIAHGCDSLVHLTFTFEEMGIENSNIERCYGDSYTFENITRTATADTNLFYIDNSGECPVRYNLAVTVNPVKATTVPQTVCDTYTWPVNGQTYTVSGEYPATLATTKNCDSVVTLNLTVNYQNTGVETDTACDNFVWDLNGVNYTATTNEPTFTLQNQWGCDSVVTLNLTVNYRSYHPEFHCVSDTDTYTWSNGRTYNLNVDVADSIQFVTGTNAAGCNEIALLHLIMNPVVDTLAWANVEACDEYVVNNHVVIDINNCEGVVEPLYLRESGDFQFRTRATDGHDQWTRIHLTVTPSSYHTTVATACLPYTWTIVDANNNPFEIATITAEMVNGASPFNMSVDLAEAGFVTSTCSSIEVLRLTPKYPSTETIEDAICQNETWTAPNPYTYSVNGNDLNVGLNTQTYNLGSGDVNTDNCPLTKQVNLTVNPTYAVASELTFCESDFALNQNSGEYEVTVADAEHEGANVVLTIPGALNDAVYTNTIVANWQTALGCDSIVTITYTVNPTIHQTVVVADACHEYTWDVNGNRFDAPGTYTDHAELIDQVTGCRIIKNLELTVLGTSEGSETIDVCTSFIGPDNVTYYNTHTFDVPYEGTDPIYYGCDSITHVTYNVRQNALIENNVVTNQPYTWVNGETYTQSVDNIYHQLPPDANGCYDVLVLKVTMVDPIVLCNTELPYTATYGNTQFTIAAGASSDVWNNNNADGNDTIIAYTIKNATAVAIYETACDSYTWTNGNGETYTTTGEYVYTTTNAAGCDSVVTLNLTVNSSSSETVTEVACDSYTWTNGNGQTYTTSGNYTWTTTNADNCEHLVTLALTINKNDGEDTTVNNGCDSYTWTDGNGQTYTASGDYSFQFTDANGCVGDSVLHLTINQSDETNSTLVINEAASYTYLGIMYEAPYDGVIDHTFTNRFGCDSIDHLHLIIPIVNDNQIVEVNVAACGSYTWTIAGVEHTYIWIPMSERQSHGMAMYKDATMNQYVYTYPTDTTFDANGAMTHVDVLHLNLLESTTSTETVNVPVSLGSYTIYGVAGNVEGDPIETVNFTYADRGTTMVMDHPVGVGSVAYCDDYRTYTINIIDNYDTTEVYACADDATYEWNNVTYNIGTPGHTFEFVQKENEGTMNELVHILKVNQRAVNAETVTETVCDTYTWTAGNGETYTNSVNGVVYNYTDANGCAATKTLNLTVNHNSNTEYTDAACDTYTWTRNNQTYTTSGVYYYNYTNDAGCASVDSIILTINNNSNQTFTEAACNSYEWAAAEGGNGQTYTTSGTYTYNYNAANGCPSVNTLSLTINLPTDAEETLVVCDSTEWHGTKYYTSGDYNYDYTSAAGCASTDVLHLTVNNATHDSETLTQCDSYEWHGTTYTASSPVEGYMYSYTDANNCPSVDTLHLTINVNTTGVEVTETACDEYTWTINNRLYTTSGNYTATTTDANGCGATNTLHLTINHTSSYDSVLYISDGSYRYYGQTATELFGVGVYNRTEHYTNAAGCDSALNITFNVGTALLGIENVVNCNEYTWRNGETYVWISDEERAAHLNGDAVAPLYKTSTGTYIYYNPTFTVERENAYDSIYMLALTLTQSYVGNAEVTVNVSEGSYTYRDTTYYFAEAAAQQQEFVNDVLEVEYHFDTNLYCEGIIYLTINLVNNYQEYSSDDICVTTDSYTWRGHTISTATNDYDHAHTYYVYDTLATGMIEYKTIRQHPLAYATERRTACDSYTWNGTTYTESTSNATAYFPEGTVFNAGTDNEYTLICDSTVTLILTINHNTSTEYNIAECETYTWTAANGGNGETYTESGTYTRDYYTAQGCPSTNTLNLTINHNTSAEYTVDVCDSYTWTAEEGGNGTVYTTSSPAEGYTYSYNTTEGCPSVNTLHLTIRNNSDQTINKTACDTYTWTAAEGGNGDTYTTSGVYTYDYEAANGCPSTNTLNLTVNQNSGHPDVLVACDSVMWHGTWYYADNNTATYNYADTNNCPSVDALDLTINHATHNTFTEVACDTYTWNNNGNTNTYTTSGTYTSVYTNDENCPSSDILNLTIGHGHAYHRDTVVFCGPYTWTVNNQIIGTYSENVQTSTTVENPATGCDSTLFLYLTINPQNVTEIAICEGTEYEWTVNNTAYTEAGTYDVSETDANGNCISNERLVLTVNPVMVTNITDQICLGNGYTDNGFNIPASELAAAGVYTRVDHRTTDAGCEHTYNLTLTVGDVITNTLAEVAACDSYTWNNTVYTESGTYESAPYANDNGCTTIDILPLTINVNASTEYTETVCDGYMWNGTQYTESGDYTYDYPDGNGCASTDVLHLTVNSSVIRNIPMTVCDSYTWDEGDGETYTASGVYTYNYTTTDGCNGTDYLVLTVNTNSSNGYTATACDTYTWNGTEYTTSGDYTYAYTDANNCASVDTLHLTVNYNTNTEFDATACDSYTWNGQTYTQSGDYNFDYINNKGCASTDILHLTLNFNTNNGEAETACNSFTWNGTTYTQSGTYYRHYNTAEGCASVDTLFLTINNNATATLAETACDSYLWNGNTYTASGIYTYNTTAANGCDSIVTLNLTVNHNTNSAETATACNSYTWNGQTYTTSGNYTYNYNAANGCASVDTLHLTVNNGVTGTATAEACNYYIWNGTAYTQSGTYTQTLDAANGCDSVVTLTLTINTMVTNTVTASACGNYVWNGAVYTTSGNYTQNFSSAAGCDSVVTLVLTINPAITNNVTATACNNYNWNGTNYTTSGIYSHTYTSAAGCDSIVNLLLTVNHTVNNTVNATACDSYTWNNQNYTTSGFYTMTFAGAASNGCDSVAHLALTINNSAATTLNASACNSYTWNGATYTTTGSYTQNLRTVNNCDSVVTLNLTLNQAVTNTVNQTACDIYTWNGTTYTTSGVYTHTYSSAAGCDSVVTLNLTIAPTITVTMPVTACDSYTMDTVTYTTSGTFTRYYLAAGGCDSIVTYNLTINNSNAGVENTTACDSYTWIDGQTYTATTNTPTWTLTNAAGCDSVVTLNLSVVYHTTGVDVEAACDSYTWMDGQTYTVSTNTPVYTLTGANGCDSIVTLNLTVNYSTFDTVDVAICDSFEWEGVVYDQSGTYIYVTTTTAGCDSNIVVNLTVNHSVETYDTLAVDKSELPYLYGERYLTEAGDYEIAFTTVTGCDSTVYLHFVVEGVGIDVTSALEELKVYPNPTHGRVTLTAENVLKIEVLDIVGRLVATFENTNTFDISNLNEGAYTLRITLPEGVTIRKVVKK